MNHLKAIIPFAVCIAGSALACTACQAQEAQRSCGFVTGVQKRVVEHADRSVESLRGYVTMEHNISGIDMDDVKESLDTWRATVRCQREVAAAAAAATVAKQQAGEQPEAARQVVVSGR